MLAAALLLTAAHSRADDGSGDRTFAAELLSLGGVDEAGFQKMVDGVRASRKPPAGTVPITPGWEDVRKTCVDAIVADLPREPLQAFHDFLQTATGRGLAAKVPGILVQGTAPSIARAYGVDPAAVMASAGVSAW